MSPQPRRFKVSGLDFRYRMLTEAYFSRDHLKLNAGYIRVDGKTWC